MRVGKEENKKWETIKDKWKQPFWAAKGSVQLLLTGGGRGLCLLSFSSTVSLKQCQL